MIGLGHPDLEYAHANANTFLTERLIRIMSTIVNFLMVVGGLALGACITLFLRARKAPTESVVRGHSMLAASAFALTTAIMWSAACGVDAFALTFRPNPSPSLYYSIDACVQGGGYMETPASCYPLSVDQRRELACLAGGGSWVFRGTEMHPPTVCEHPASGRTFEQDRELACIQSGGSWFGNTLGLPPCRHHEDRSP